MAEQNLFEQLKEVLADFKEFLSPETVSTIKPAIAAIASLVPQVTELIDLLVGLLGKLKTEIQNLDVASIAGLEEVSEFTDKVKGFLEAAKKLLPDETASIDTIADAADVVTGLPGVEAVKGEIIDLLDHLVGVLNSLKP